MIRTNFNYEGSPILSTVRRVWKERLERQRKTHDGSPVEGIPEHLTPNNKLYFTYRNDTGTISLQEAKGQWLTLSITAPDGLPVNLQDGVQDLGNGKYKVKRGSYFQIGDCNLRLIKVNGNKVDLVPDKDTVSFSKEIYMPSGNNYPEFTIGDALKISLGNNGVSSLARTTVGQRKVIHLELIPAGTSGNLKLAVQSPREVPVSVRRQNGRVNTVLPAPDQNELSMQLRNIQLDPRTTIFLGDINNGASVRINSTVLGKGKEEKVSLSVLPPKGVSVEYVPHKN